MTLPHSSPQEDAHSGKMDTISEAVGNGKTHIGDRLANTVVVEKKKKS